MLSWLIPVVALCTAAWTVTAAQAPAQPAPPAPVQDLEHPQNTNAGIYAFTGHCACCHDTGKDGATDRYALTRHTPEEVLASITTGSMAKYAQSLSEFEKRVVAVYVGGRPLGAAAAGDASQMKNRCESRPAFDPLEGSAWNGWGFDSGNSRFQTVAGADRGRRAEARAQVGVRVPERQLRLRAADRSPAAASSSAPTPASSTRSTRASGCIYWSFRANAGVRAAPAIGPGKGANRFLAYFGDMKGNIYAVDAETGAQVWKDRIDPHPVARVTGAPNGRRGPRLRADVVARGIGRRQPELSLLHLPRRRGRVRRADGQAHLEVVHDHRSADAAQENVEGHAAVGTGGRQRVVVADDRSEAARDLRRHRQRLHRAGCAAARTR